jgi:hypothetical protein
MRNRTSGAVNPVGDCENVMKGRKERLKLYFGKDYTECSKKREGKREDGGNTSSRGCDNNVADRGGRARGKANRITYRQKRFFSFQSN